MIQHKAEIILAIEEAFEEVASYVEALTDAEFSAAPPGKWSPGTQVAHLVRSAEPVNLVLRLPRFLLGAILGKSRRESHVFDEIAGKYREALEHGGKASGRYVPKVVPAARRDATLAAYRREKRRLCAAIARWDEADLDRYVVPHPLIGKITLREVLFFTVYHTRHHAGSIRSLTGT